MGRPAVWQAGLGVLLVSSFLHADCQCPKNTDQELLRSATYAFAGTVEDIANSKDGKKVITFTVVDQYKGNPKDDFSLTDSLAGTECAIDFKVGDDYVVYAHWLWAEYYTSRCYGTKLLKSAGQDMKTLGPAGSIREKIYQRMHNECRLQEPVKCCWDSIKAMSEGGYLPEPPDGCPSGTVPDRLRCPTSYVWCIPAGMQDHRQ